MTRYLDREPQAGDTVEVSFTGRFSHRGAMTGVVIVKCPPVGDPNWGTTTLDCTTPPDATVRVIAPEPQVGGDWTPDADLPDGSILEWPSALPTTHLAINVGGEWWDGNRKINPQAAGTPWRIVRIGAAS